MAATVVDALLVTLELDSAKFSAGIGKALTALKELETSAKSMTLGGSLKSAGVEGEKAGDATARGMTRGALGVGMLIAAVYKLNNALGLPAIKKMTQEVVDSETKTIRLADSLQLSSTEMQAWQKTVQVHGGNVGGFNASLEKMSANLGKLGTNVRGAKILQQYLGLAGVTDAMVKGKDALGVLKLFGEQMQTMSVERQYLVGRKLGLDDASIRTLQETGPMLIQQVGEMRALAAANDELQNARQVAIAQEEANLQWERATQVIGAAFLPVLKKLADGLKFASQWIREHQDTVKKAVIIVGAALAGLAVIAAAASLAIFAAGVKIAIGMTLATGGAWAVGAAAGVAALTALAVAAGLSAAAFGEVESKHAAMVDELLNGDAKMQNAYRHQQLLAQYTEQAAHAFNDLISQIKIANAETDKLREKKTVIMHGELVSVGDVDTAAVAKSQAKVAMLEARFRKLQELEAARVAALTSGTSQFQMAHPIEAARIAAGIGAAEQKASNVVNVDQITVHVGEHSQADALALSINTRQFRAASGPREIVHQIQGGQH